MLQHPVRGLVALLSTRLRVRLGSAAHRVFISPRWTLSSCAPLPISLSSSFSAFTSFLVSLSCSFLPFECMFLLPLLSPRPISSSAAVLAAPDSLARCDCRRMFVAAQLRGEHALIPRAGWLGASSLMCCSSSLTRSGPSVTLRFISHTQCIPFSFRKLSFGNVTRCAVSISIARACNCRAKAIEIDAKWSRFQFMLGLSLIRADEKSGASCASVQCMPVAIVL